MPATEENTLRVKACVIRRDRGLLANDNPSKLQSTDVNRHLNVWYMKNIVHKTMSIRSPPIKLGYGLVLYVRRYGGRNHINVICNIILQNRIRDR